MKPSVKRIVSVFLVLFLLTVFLSCGRSEEPELFYSYDSSEGEWAKYSFFADVFHYYEELNRKTMERTAYRLIKRNKETGELSHVCIDPVCSHEPYSDCPLTSLYGISTSGRCIGDWLIISKKPDPTESNRGLASFATSLCVYNLLTGELRTLFEPSSVEQYATTVYKNLLYVFSPDLVDGKTVYKLSSYDPDKDQWKELMTCDKMLMFTAVSNKRIYLAEATLAPIEGTESFSVDHNGENRREEPEMNMPIAFTDGGTAYGSAYRDLESSLRVFAGYYFKFNVNTREYVRIPESEGASVLGLWKGKLVYATCKDLELGVGINKWEYARENGLDASDPEASKAVNEIRNRVFFGDRMYIKVCDIDGTNTETLFEYPGIFFGNGWVVGDQMTVQCDYLDPETGRQAQKTQRIDLNTGEFEDVPVYTLGDSDKVYTRPKQGGG